MTTLDELEVFAARPTAAARLMSAKASSVGKTVFLAHSSKDSKYLPGVVEILEASGGKVYVDKLDESLPETTNQETARKLRSTINACLRFVVFVTTNSKDSRWVPWELGLADGKKSTHAVALFPATKNINEQRWAQQEYLGLYQRIVWGRIEEQKPRWIVLDHRKNEAWPLSRWLKGG